MPFLAEDLAVLLSKHALPIALKANSDDSPIVRAYRATATLMWTGQRHVFITCWHVMNELQDMQRINPSAQMAAYIALNSGTAELTGFTLLDFSKRTDVAVLGALEDNVHLPGLYFVDYESSYLGDPVVGDSVSIVGYPGVGTSVTLNRAVFGFTHLGFMASCVSDHRITLADETGGREFIHYDDPACRRIDFGGLSGSPAFAWREGRARFIGIVTDCHETDGTVLISRLGCIKPDGTLDHLTIPP